MRTRVALLPLLLLLLIVVPLALAQTTTTSEQTIESSDSTATSSTTTTTTTTNVTVIPQTTPSWIHLVRIAATAGPIAFLVLALLIATIVHFRLVLREQAQFPAVRGSRTPQLVPMIISGALFLIPIALFIFFEFRSRKEIALGIAGVVDEWQPVTTHAWTVLVICLVLAQLPWMFARRADSI